MDSKKILVDIVKTQGPNAAKFVKNNWKHIADTASVIDSVGQKLKNRKSSDRYIEKLHHRKLRYTEYKTKVLRELENKNRYELFNHKLEVEQFIQQINNEQSSELAVKKPLYSKRLNNWNDILIQIEDKISTKDYHEYLMIYNNLDYQSTYFDRYEVHKTKFKELVNSGNTDELYNYILAKTNKSIDDIKRDFL